MTRKEMLRLLLNHAQSNGFEFRPWFQIHIQRLWPGSEQALSLLASGGRHYTLLFSHEFARCFWQTGAQISFTVPSTTYSRTDGRGSIVEVTRRPFTRRTVKPNVWKYHLGQMATKEDPIAYLCRFLPQQEQAKLRAADKEPLEAKA